MPRKKNTKVVQNTKNKKSFLLKIRKYLLAGLVFVGPLVVTILIITWLLNFIDSIFIKIINFFPNKNIVNMLDIPGVGVIAGFLFILLIGFIGTNFIGRYFINLSDKFFNKIPIIKPIYSTIKQVFDTLFSNKSEAFKQAVLIEYPLKGVWTIAFVTSKIEGDFKKSFDDAVLKSQEILSVFVPTTPNPTSGFLLFVPKKSIIPLNIPTNVAMKLIISGGMINPNPSNNDNKLLPR